MMMQIVGSFAESERAMLSTRYGLLAARKEGREWRTRFQLTPQQQEIVQLVLCPQKKSRRCRTPVHRSLSTVVTALGQEQGDVVHQP
jgi:DNA invertase Pin-like site-specific DNA recombinase